MFAWMTLAIVLGEISPSEAVAVKAALTEFGSLVGDWNGTATPMDRAARRRREFHRESSHWQWKLTRQDVGLVWTISDGKYLHDAFLTFDPTKREFVCTANFDANSHLILRGVKQGARLEVSGDAENGDSWRLTISNPSADRFTYSLARKEKGAPAFANIVETGNTRKGVSFASKNTGPTCIVTGGAGSMELTYKGKTYYVCCSGCKEAFESEPEKYIAEAKAKSRAKK